VNALSFSDLLVQTAKLKKLAADEMAKLEAQGKQALAGNLQKLDKVVIDLEAQIQALSQKGKNESLGLFETALNKLETDMEAEIKKLSGSLYFD
jgi:hypothetical protein